MEISEEWGYFLVLKKWKFQGGWGDLHEILSMVGVWMFSGTTHHIDTSVLLENTSLVKFIRNYIWDSSGIFCASSLVKISMISPISSVSLKLYINSVVYDQNIFGSSSKAFGNLQKSLEIFRNFQTYFSENVQERSPGKDTWKFFGNLWKIVKKTPSSVWLYNKKNIAP